MTSSLFSLPFFLLVSVLSFTIPGLLLINKANYQFSPWEKLILGTVVGFVVFTLAAYFLLSLHLNILLLPLILVTDVFGLRSILHLRNEFKLPPKSVLLILLAVFTLGITGQLAVISPSGRFINQELVFWSAHGHDSMWHIALMEEIKKGFPLQNPVFAGEKLVNYHFFSDIAPAMFSRYLPLTNLDLYFRYFPWLFSFLLGSLAFLLGKKLGGTFYSGLWATIFTYFAGSFGYIVTWIQNHTIGGESIFWATQVQSSVGNPPQIAAFIIVLAFLLLLLDFLNDQKNWRKLLICAALAGSLIEFKVYGGVVVLGSLMLIGTWQLIKERRVHLLVLAITSCLLAAILYLPNTVSSVGFLIWEPWWFIRTMVVVPGRLNLLDWELRRQTYLVEHNLKRVIFLESLSFTIFFFGNLGMRFLGIFILTQNLKSIFRNYFNLFTISILLSSLILPLLFLQKGVASNTIQFMQYFLLLMGVLAGISVSKLLTKVKFPIFKIGIGLVIIIAAIPTQIALLDDFYKRPPNAKITREELVSLQFLQKNTRINDIILTPPYNKNLDLHFSTPPIWAWFDTAYVSALSSRRTYLSDTEQVDIMGYDLKKRGETAQQLFQETDSLTFVKTLKENRINYLYFPQILKPEINLPQTNLTQVYKNNSIEIWKVN